MHAIILWNSIVRERSSPTHLIFSENRRHRGKVKNKVEIRGVFLVTIKHAANSPQKPRISPQLHHKKLHSTHTLSQNTPQKRP
jgi:hypothetical protein